MSRVRKVGEWIFSAKRHSTSVSLDRRSVYSFDLEGRPISWYADGRVYKRSLASEVHGRERKAGEKRYWRVSTVEAESLFAGLFERLAGAPAERTDPALSDRLATILSWNPERLLAERERFEAAYRPVSILPPDQYLAVVLQATFGCSWNRCTFCSFYQDQPFRLRPPSEFREHCDRVRDLLGRGEKLRRQIFLADGNALVLANERLRPLLEASGECFPEREINGFVDVYTGERKSAAEWEALKRIGLSRVFVGLETGHDDLLRWLNKPGSGAEAAEFVTTLKSAGLRVSVILMVGVGGRRFAAGHVGDTLRLMDRLPLGKGDVVYLSPFHELPGSEYARRAGEKGFAPLDAAEHTAQYATLRDGSRRALPGTIVTRYDLREFVY